MNKEQTDGIIKLTKTCLERFWQKDIDFVLSYCDEDVVWIGSQQEQFKRGLTETTEDYIRVRSEMQSCHLLCAEYEVVSNTNNACTVVGKYLTTTDNDADYFLQVQQRCTFVWESKNGEYKIRHIHVSNPLGELKAEAGEHFVNAIGKMAHYYLERRQKALNNEKRITITTDDGAISFLYPSDIMYVRADKKFCFVQTYNGLIHTKNSISEMSERLGVNFLSIHRTYVVNVYCVAQIVQNGVVMEDDTFIPITPRKFAAIKKQLITMNENKQKSSTNDDK